MKKSSTHVNSENIVKVIVRLKEEAHNFTYREASGKWWWKKPAGFYQSWFYDDGNPYFATAKEFEEGYGKKHGYYVEDNVVYAKPYLIMWLANNQKEEVYFNSVEELTEWVESKIPNFKNYIVI